MSAAQEQDAPVPEREYFSVSTATKGERKVLLVANDTMKGSTFLAHCIDSLIGHYKGVKRLCFIPYGESDKAAYTNKVRSVFAPYGIEVYGIHEPSLEDPKDTAKEVLLCAEAVLVGGGNTFLLQNYVQNLNRTIAARVWAGMPLAAFGSGVHVAGQSIQNTTDMPVLLPSSLRGQGLVPFNLHVMYQDAVPNSQASKPTVAEQIDMFHEGSQVPVLALRDGAFIRVIGDSCMLGGSSAGARLFLRNTDAIEYAKGSDLDFLILQNLKENLEFQPTIEEKALDTAEKLQRQVISQKRKAMASSTGQRVTKSLEEGRDLMSSAGRSFTQWSSSTFTKLKNDMSGVSSYPKDDDEEN